MGLQMCVNEGHLQHRRVGAHLGDHGGVQVHVQEVNSSRPCLLGGRLPMCSYRDSPWCPHLAGNCARHQADISILALGVPPMQQPGWGRTVLIQRCSSHPQCLHQAQHPLKNTTFARIFCFYPCAEYAHALCVRSGISVSEQHNPE